MKLTKILEEVITEIGDASAKPYDWTQATNTEESKKYKFITDSDINYLVGVRLQYYEFDANHPDYASVEFSVIKKGEDGDYYPDYYVSTNKGELYRVMATIVDILKDLLRKNKHLVYIEFEADKEGKNKSQRANLYAAYVKKHLPNANIERQEEDNHEKVVIKIDRKSNSDNVAN